MYKFQTIYIPVNVLITCWTLILNCIVNNLLDINLKSYKYT